MSIQVSDELMAQLLAAARSARQRAYAPYSGFAVGAALLDEHGVVHAGCNIENAAYPQSQCAEASAIAHLVLAGGRRILAAVVVGVTPDLVSALDAAGPFGMGWPGPRIALGPLRMIKADIVGTNHLRMIVGGIDGGSFKAIAFRAVETEMGQALLHGSKGRRFWLAGRPKLDDWGSRPAAELHVEDAAWAD